VVLRVDEVERLGQADVVVECCDISFELSSSSGWTMLVSRLQMDLNYGDLFLDGWIILVLDGPYLLAVFLMISFEKYDAFDKRTLQMLHESSTSASSFTNAIVDSLMSIYENRMFRWIDGCCDTLKQLTLPPTGLVAIEMLELGVLSLNGSITMAIQQNS
jgi:hypothetical protein